MAGGAHVPLYIGLCDRGIVVRPAGPCTMLICDALRVCLDPFSEKCQSDVSIDLADSPLVDSTFVGYLVSFAKRRRAADATPVALLHVAPAVRQSMQAMHVLEMFEMASAPPERPTEWVEVPPGRADAGRLAELVIQAHESLMQADERNVAVFQRVVQGFRHAAAQAGPPPP